MTFYLSQIKQQQHLNALVHVFDQEALQRADQLDEQRLSEKKIGKLHGIVITIKESLLINYILFLQLPTY